MVQVAELAQEISEVKGFRSSRRNKLKRTFVGAQDAVQAKLKKTDAPRQLEDWGESERLNIQNAFCQPIIKFNESQKSENLRSLLKDVIYFEMPQEDQNGSLNKTIAAMQKAGKLQMKFDAAEKKFYYIFNDQIVGEGLGDAKKTAKKVADGDLVETLKANCFTIKIKQEFFTTQNVVEPKDRDSSMPEKSGQLQEGNLGFKMLKMLGWKGGSLGTKGDGIIDPINQEIKIGRGGLGANSSEQFDKKYFGNLLRNFKSSQVEYDLVFSSEFTKDERANIHQ